MATLAELRSTVKLINERIKRDKDHVSDAQLAIYRKEKARFLAVIKKIKDYNKQHKLT